MTSGGFRQTATMLWDITYFPLFSTESLKSLSEPDSWKSFNPGSHTDMQNSRLLGTKWIGNLILTQCGIHFSLFVFVFSL